MATGYTRQSSGQIVTGAAIQASHFNNEFNAIEAFAHASSGHNHDGTAGGGAAIAIASITGVSSFALTVLDDTTAGAMLTTLDPGLASIAGLTTAADKMIYTTASDTYATTDLSVFARTILDDADAATVRTTISAQALDATLTALAGVTTSADVFPYFTGSDTATTATVTSFARTILDDTDAATVRTTISAQALDATLTALAAYNTNGILTQTAADTFAGRTITGTANQITVTNGDGVSGNPTLSLEQDIDIAADVEFGSVTAGDITGHRPIVSVSGTSKTFALTDADTFQQCNNGSTQTLTVPPNSSVAFATGTEIELWQEGAGQVVVAAGVGVTIRSKDGNLKVFGQYSGACLKKIATDTWLLVGDLAA